MIENHGLVDLIQEEKDALRKDLSFLFPCLKEPGKIAQQLRRIPFYRRAEQVFVSPGSELSQVRINCLLDGKRLITPGPALKDGFYEFHPYSIDFTDLEYAVSLKGLKKFGKVVDLSRKLSVDLFLTEGLALDGRGGRLGDGNGFFDLAFALLVQSCPGNAASRVGMICNEEQVLTSRPIPQAPWDVTTNFCLSSAGWHSFVSDDDGPPRIREAGPIYWHRLSEDRIRKVTPLWKIWKNRS